MGLPIGTSLASTFRRHFGTAGGRRGSSMSGWLRSVGLAVFCAVLGITESVAATSSRMDILSDDAAGSPAESRRCRCGRPIARPAPATSKPAPRGNPLWSVPLSALTGTQERPIFSAMRRPPPRAVAAAPVEEAHRAAAEAGRSAAAADAGRGRGGRGRCHRDPRQPHRSEGRPAAAGRIAGRLVADLGPAARGDTSSRAIAARCWRSSGRTATAPASRAAGTARGWRGKLTMPTRRSPRSRPSCRVRRRRTASRMGSERWRVPVRSLAGKDAA